MSKVRATNYCWLWIPGSAAKHGYGQFWVKDRSIMAHRAAFLLLVGRIPTGYHIDHLCFNKLCVNPEHLEAVTSAENARRANRVVGQVAKKACPYGHPYNKPNTGRHKNWASGISRYCRTCQNIQTRKRRAKLRKLWLAKPVGRWVDFRDGRHKSSLQF